MKRAEHLTELRAMDVTELRQKVVELDDQIFRIRIQKSMGQMESANKLQPLRREIARLETIIRQKGAGG